MTNVASKPAPAPEQSWDCKEDLYMEFVWKTAPFGHSVFQSRTGFLWKMQRQRWEEAGTERRAAGDVLQVPSPFITLSWRSSSSSCPATRAQGSSSALPGTGCKLPALFIRKLLTVPSPILAVPAQTMMNTGLLPFRIINIPFPEHPNTADPHPACEMQLYVKCNVLCQQDAPGTRSTRSALWEEAQPLLQDT